MIILLTVAHQLNLGRAAQLRQRTRGHDLLIRDEPLKNRALQSSYPNREVLRILLPLTCVYRLQMRLAVLRMRLILVGQNRRVPTTCRASTMWVVAACSSTVRHSGLAAAMAPP